jgi:hypothetical protein
MMSKTLAKLNGYTMKTENIFVIAVLIAILSGIGSTAYYNYTEVKSMEKNIDSAIAKGIDPLAVKCAYSKYADNICITYAMSISRK